MDLISVVIPTFNRGNLIVRSVNSVLNQTYSNVEVIVVDDGSSDNTFDLISKINDKRLKYYKLESNKGANFARNYGISKASGKYIAFHDSDDVFRPDKLRLQLENMKRNKSFLDFCKVCINLSSDDSFILPNDDMDKEFNNDSFLNVLCKGNFISTQAILVKREVLDKINFDDSLPRFQDYDLVIRICSKYKVSYTNDILVDLYRQDDSISNSSLKLKKACLIMLRKDYNLSIEQNDILNETLIKWFTMDDFNQLNDKLFKLEKEYQSLNENNTLIENKYNELLLSYDKIIKERDEFINNYHMVVNSKRWKFINKFFHFFGK